MKQIRKEVGLSAFNQISTNESLGFFGNDFATNPVQKNKAHQMNYKILMLKIDLFFMNRFHGVFLN
jgi:NAD/NADP transhydrogenase alpha subunit